MKDRSKPIRDQGDANVWLHFEQTASSAFRRYLKWGTGFELFLFYSIIIGSTVGFYDENTGAPLPFPGWPFYAKWSLAILAGFLIPWIWRYGIGRLEFGSQINLATRQIIWWKGPSPAKLNTIDINKLRFVKWELRLGRGHRFAMQEEDGKISYMPTSCVKNEILWLTLLNSQFPHIDVAQAQKALEDLSE